jgi:hypothetical protein
MIEFGNDCITLENNWCSGDRSTGRWFCPRKIYGFWRECWLERIDPPVEADEPVGSGERDDISA